MDCATSEKGGLVEVELATAKNPLFELEGQLENQQFEDEEVVLFNRSDGSERSNGRSERPEDSGRVSEDSGWLARLNRWIETKFFDPAVPREAQLFRHENICIVLCYVLVGLYQGMSGGIMNVYPMQLGATEAQQTTIKALRALPASFKILYGFLSDSYPLFGYRRKLYMAIGWSLCTLSMGLLFVCPGDPSIPFLSLMYLLFGFGFWFADVMADTLVAEKAKLEPEGTQGTLQSTCYAYRFFFLMLGVIASTFLFEVVGPRNLFCFMALCPVLIILVPWIWLKEERNVPVSSVKAQCVEIWSTVSNRSVFQPMAFVYLYNALQVGNAAWTQFLSSTLEFSTEQINGILIAAEVLLFAGVISYKQIMRNWSWRLVYVMCIGLNLVFSMGQVLLILGLNKPIPDFAFAVGDEAVLDFISGVQFLPTTIMMVHLCPKGSEGVSYAMFTTMNNVALTLSSNMSTLLLGIWDVSKEALEEDRLGGMVKLTVLTTCIQTAGVFFLPLLPEFRSDLEKLKTGRSDFGGAVFLGIIGFTLVWAVIEGFLNIFFPGWSGES